MQNKKYNRLSPALERYKPGEISKNSNMINNQKNNIYLINENFNRSLMNNNNLDKSPQKFQSLRIQENANANVVDNITINLNKLSMDEIFRELILNKSKNIKENNQIANKRNLNFLENYTKIPNVLIRVSEIRSDYDPESKKAKSTQFITDASFNNNNKSSNLIPANLQFKYQQANKFIMYNSTLNNSNKEEAQDTKPKLNQFIADSNIDLKPNERLKPEANSIGSQQQANTRIAKINFKTIPAPAIQDIATNSVNNIEFLNRKRKKEDINSSDAEANIAHLKMQPMTNKLILNTKEEQPLNKNPAIDVNSLNQLKQELNKNEKSELAKLQQEKFSLFERVFLNLKNMMNSKKFYLQLTVNPDKTLFDIIYTRKSNDNVTYTITYDKERKLILNMNKKINNVPDTSYAFNLNSFLSLEAAEKCLKEEFSRIFSDIKKT